MSFTIKYLKMSKEIQLSNYKGVLFTVESSYKIKKDKVRFFEKATRPPGVRMIFLKGDTILLSKEKRRELNDWDFRLPGGKVFDAIDDYLSVLEKEDSLDKFLKKAVIDESIEEVGINVTEDNIKFLHKSIAGSSVAWDLYYFIISEFEFNEGGQQLEDGEIIEKPIFVSKDKVLEMCLNNEIKEDRTVAVLFRLLGKKKNIQ